MNNEVETLKIKRMKSSKPDYTISRYYGGRFSITDQSGESEIMTSATAKRIGDIARDRKDAVFVIASGLSRSNIGLMQKLFRENTNCYIDTRTITRVSRDGTRHTEYLIVVDGEYHVSKRTE